MYGISLVLAMYEERQVRSNPETAGHEGSVEKGEHDTARIAIKERSKRLQQNVSRFVSYVRLLTLDVGDRGKLAYPVQANHLVGSAR